MSSSLFIRTLFLISFCLLGSASMSASGPTAKDLSAEEICLELVDTIRSELAVKYRESENQHLRLRDPMYRIQQDLEQKLTAYIKDQNWNQARLVAQRNLPTIESDEIREGLSKLLEKILFEKQKQKDLLIDRFDTFEKSISKRILEYKNSKDLDEPIMEMNELSEAIDAVPYWGDGEKPVAYKLHFILTVWQEYLFYKETKDRREVEQRLRTLENKLGSYNLIPRSAVLELKNQLSERLIENELSKEMESILEKLNGPVSYAAVLDKFRNLKALNDRNHKVSTYVTMLEKLFDAWRAIESEDSSTALSLLSFIREESTYGNDHHILKERDFLNRLALAVSYERQLQPKDDENTAAFILRLAETLGSEERWIELRDFLDRVNRSRLLPNDTWHYQEQQITNRLIAATRYMEIGQNVTAYNLFSQVLESACRFGQYRAAQKGLESLAETDPSIAARARAEKEELRALRTSIEQSIRQSNMAGPIGDRFSDEQLRKVIKAATDEYLAENIKTDAAGVDPFVTGNSVAVKLPHRFQLVYLNENEDKISSVYTDFEQEGQPSLRLVGDHRRQLDDVVSIRVLNPISRKTMSEWPKRFGNGIKIPRTQIELTLVDRTIERLEVYSTLWWSFLDRESPKGRLKLHPCRVISVTRVD